LIERVLGVAARAAALTLVVACAGGAPPPANAGTTSPNNVPPNAGGGPTPGAEESVSIPPDLATRLPKARVPVPSPDAPSRGPASAPVTIQIFSDFECPFCAMAAPLVRELESEFGGSVRIVWRNLPLTMHPHAELAAETGLEIYAERGGAAFWRFHDATFAAQQKGLDEGVILALAEAEGVDRERSRAALAARTHAPKIEADLNAADLAGINGTPAFFVNDWLAVGALPYPEMRLLVLQALRERGAGAGALAPAVPPSTQTVTTPL
jgi:protein-disulfide isomerase